MFVKYQTTPTPSGVQGAACFATLSAAIAGSLQSASHDDDSKNPAVSLLLLTGEVVVLPMASFPQMAAPRTPTHWLTILCLMGIGATSLEAYFADWSVLGGRPHEPTCVDIPINMSLCSDIGYNKMRLPNLLDHDTLTEVQQQSGSWVPLLNVQCHPYTKLFLCSLFTPVCLESEIFPCRSLCNSVQQSCESRMRTYGYYWPDMLRCDKFPVDNDMCIKAPDEKDLASISTAKGSSCSACNPVDTYENILDNFCRAHVVLKAKIRKFRGKKVSLRKTKTFKSDEKSKVSRRRVRLLLGEESTCCKLTAGKQKYLIMGLKEKKNFITPTFILPWKKSKALHEAVQLFPNLNCADPNLFSTASEDGTILPKVQTTPAKVGKRKKKIQQKLRKRINRAKSKKKFRKRKRGKMNRNHKANNTLNDNHNKNN